MTLIARRTFIIGAAAFALSACSSATMPAVMPASDGNPENLTQGEIMAAINAVRAANGRSAWAWNGSLAVASRTHAGLMAQRDELSHELGGRLRARVAAAGYQGAVGENLAGGQMSLAQAIEGWLNSPGHRATLLSDKFVEFGLAARRAPAGSRYGTYWAMIAGGSFDAWRTWPPRAQG